VTVEFDPNSAVGVIIQRLQAEHFRLPTQFEYSLFNPNKKEWLEDTSKLLAYSLQQVFLFWRSHALFR
jgi:hypothetical protein